jgi:F-type H+-transporting ATPase subunit delta
MAEPVKIDAEIWDVSARRIASVYAEALLNAAQKQGQVDAVLEELDSLVKDVFNRDPRLETLFSAAVIGRKARAEAIAKAFEGRASDTFYRFLLVLNEHERLDLLRAILIEARDLNDERRRRLRVLVYSAVPISDAQSKAIETGVRQRFELEPVIVPILDPSVLGGLKIRIGDRQLDATVRARLDSIRQQLLERSSHEIQSGRDRYSTAVGN